MRFEFLSLKLFVTVYETRNIARAAELEHMAASAISKRISDLEMKVNAPLFYRRARGLEPTLAGQALLRHAHQVLRAVKELESELADHSKGLRGHVRVHTSVSPLLQQLPTDLADFLRMHPAIRIDLTEAFSPDIVRAVTENAADIGIFGRKLPIVGLRVMPYRSEELVALMSADHPLATAGSLKFQQIAEHEIIGATVGSFLDSLVMQAAIELEQPLKIRVRLSGFEAAANMAEAGLGIAFVPHSLAAHFVGTRAVTAVRIAEAWAVRHWRLCTLDSDSLPAPTRLLVEHLASRSA